MSTRGSQKTGNRDQAKRALVTAISVFTALSLSYSSGYALSFNSHQTVVYTLPSTPHSVTGTDTENDETIAVGTKSLVGQVAPDIAAVQTGDVTTNPERLNNNPDAGLAARMLSNPPPVVVGEEGGCVRVTVNSGNPLLPHAPMDHAPDSQVAGGNDAGAPANPSPVVAGPAAPIPSAVVAAPAIPSAVVAGPGPSAAIPAFSAVVGAGGSASGTSSAVMGGGQGISYNGGSGVGISGIVPDNLSDSGSRLASTASAVDRITDEVGRRGFLDTVLDKKKEFEKAAGADSAALGDAVKETPFNEMPGFFGRAQQGLDKMASDLEQAVDGSGLDTGDRNLALLRMRDAATKAAAGLGALNEDESANRRLAEASAFPGLLGPNPLSRTKGLAEIFGNGPLDQSAATAEGLVNRFVMLNGLPAEQRAAVLKKLKLVETPTFKLADGSSTTIPILHNGYIFGGGASGTDCSAFVSSALPPEVRKGRFTTLDFLQMWRYRRTGNWPKPPTYDRERERMVRETADAFTPIDIYHGQRPMVGDLLVYRVPWEAVGHVFIVRDFDPRTLNTEVIEASQSAGRIRERTFALSPDPVNAKIRVLRPGLFALRLRPTSSHVCSYKDHRSDGGGGGARQPSSEPRAPRESAPSHDADPGHQGGGGGAT